MTRLMMTTDAVGGVWTYALELAAALPAHGFETVLAVLGPSASAGQRADAAAVAGLTLIETGLPLDWTADDAQGVANAGRVVADLARRVGADLVHLNSPALAAGGDFDRPVVGVCHSCLPTWWAAVRGGEMPADFRWRADLLTQGYAACQALIAPTAAFAEATRRAHGMLPHVVWNGRRTPAASSAEPRAREVIAAGRLWDEGKGMAVLDAAAASVEAPVLAAGPVAGPNGAGIALQAVTPLGELTSEALAERMRGARIFAAPALYEPFGLAVLEAAQAGCALVLSDIPSFRELWEGAARFTPVGDAEALAHTLNTLLDDETACRGLGLAARRRSHRYTPEHTAVATAAIYRTLLGVSARTVEAVA